VYEVGVRRSRSERGVYAANGGSDVRKGAGGNPDAAEVGADAVGHVRTVPEERRASGPVSESTRISLITKRGGGHGEGVPVTHADVPGERQSGRGTRMAALFPQASGAADA